MADARDNPGVIVWPPVMFLTSLLSGLLLQWFFPWPVPVSTPIRIIIAVVLIVTGFASARWARQTMTRAGTNVNPMKPSTTIVTAGPFGYTRNPLYLSVMGIGVGISIAFGTWWPIAFLVATFPVLEFGVVRREERYLEAKFGDPYREYKRRVRRWI
jgi:protein-S-isoprenylcysteine O-methyltransferase Ste14